MAIFVDVIRNGRGKVSDIKYRPEREPDKRVMVMVEKESGDYERENYPDTPRSIHTQGYFTDEVENWDDVKDQVEKEFGIDFSAMDFSEKETLIQQEGYSMSLPTLVRKKGSRWVGSTLDGEVITDTFGSKGDLMKEIGASGSKGVGRDEHGKVYQVYYDYDVIEKEA